MPSVEHHYTREELKKQLEEMTKNLTEIIENESLEDLAPDRSLKETKEQFDDAWFKIFEPGKNPETNFYDFYRGSRRRSGRRSSGGRKKRRSSKRSSRRR